MDKYIKLDVIGKGCNGNCVIKVKNLEDNKIYALKRIIIDINDEDQIKKSLNEINIFKSVKHPNIVNYYESFIHKEKMCIIMEYADGGDLNGMIKKFSQENKKIEEDTIWHWFIQILLAIKYVHSKKILHRDIKSQNIFLTKTGNVKLGDFGISKVLENTMDYAKTSLGTPYFLSPEICSGNKYNFKTDIWMIGCVLYELTCLKKPFEGENFHKLIMNILNQEILPIPKSYSENLKDLVFQLLNKDPNLRPSIEEIFALDYVKKKFDKYCLNISPCCNEKSLFNNKTSIFDHDSILFNFGYGNLLKEIQEVENENSYSLSPKNFEKLINSNSVLLSNILNPIKIPSENKEEFFKPTNIEEKIQKYFNKNLIHVKDKTIDCDSPVKLSMEEKLKRIKQRTNSINFVKPPLELQTITTTYKVNNTCNTPESSRFYSGTSKNIQKPAQNITTVSTISNFNNNTNGSTSNSSRINSVNSNTKSKNSKESLYFINKKKFQKPISFNITSIQSPENKAIYFEENEEVELKFDSIKNEIKEKDLLPIANKLENKFTNEESLSDSKKNYKFCLNSNFKINFLVDQFGQEKVNNLIKLIETNKNPYDLLNGNGKEIEQIVGPKYKIAQNFLKIFLLNENEDFVSIKK